MYDLFLFLYFFKISSWLLYYETGVYHLFIFFYSLNFEVGCLSFVPFLLFFLFEVGCCIMRLVCITFTLFSPILVSALSLYLCESCPLPAPKRKSPTKVSPNLQYISTQTLYKYVSKEDVDFLIKTNYIHVSTACLRYVEEKYKAISFYRQW